MLSYERGCARKPCQSRKVYRLALHRSDDNLCAHTSVVTLLLMLVLGLLVVLSMDVRQKRLAFLCQQKDEHYRS
jgi:hypothetical protein